jgi:hypothetical protein
LRGVPQRSRRTGAARIAGITSGVGQKNMTFLQTDLLSDLVQQKHRCLEHLCAMGHKQLELVRRGSMTELLDLLAAKQQLLLQVQRIDRDLEPFRDQDPEDRDWRSPEGRQQCAAAASACEALLVQIINQERESETELIRRRDEAAAQLEETHTASQARASYLGRLHVGAGQLNLTSEG